MDTLLRQLGCSSVHQAATWEQASELLDHASPPFDLILLDLQMPGTDGIEVLRHLAERGFAGQILLTSGESDEILQTAGQLAEQRGLRVAGSLAKPVTRAALAPLLRQSAESPMADGRVPYGPTPEDLAGAIAGGDLLLHYQPKVAVADDTVRGAESLVRWRHPRHGMIPPGRFVALAERHGLLDPLTDEVIRLALEQAARWRTAGLEMKVSINLSMDNLHQLDLPDRLLRQTEALGLSATDIILEITESRLAGDLSAVLDILTRLRLRGFALSIDDFGTGFSSLEQLRRLPFSELKIDRAFVHHAHADPRRHAILESNVALARSLGLASVAEGVEDAADRETVAALGVDLVQGWHVAPPMSAAEFTDWLSARHAGSRG